MSESTSTSTKTVSPATLVALRCRMGLTQNEFSKLIGVHSMTISKWERGIGTPPKYNAAQILALEPLVSYIDADANWWRLIFGSLKQLIDTGLCVEALAGLVRMARLGATDDSMDYLKAV